MADATSTALGNTDVTSGGVTMPQWYQDLTTNFANNMNGALSTAGGLSSNWYSNPVAANVTSLQNNAAGNAANPYDYSSGMNQAQNSLNNYQTSFDPSQLQSFMNPYLNDQMNSLAQQSMTNLENYTLPAVNSTFTGSGQFGSTRNSNFLNQAINQNNQQLLNSQANLLGTDYQNAMQNMQQWNQNNLSAATAQQGLTQADQNAYWTNTNNQYNMGQQLQNAQQGVLSNNYQDWLNSMQIPQNMMGALTQMLPSITQMYTKAPVSTASSILPLTSTSGAGGLGALSTAAGSLLS